MTALDAIKNSRWEGSHLLFLSISFGNKEGEKAIENTFFPGSTLTQLFRQFISQVRIRGLRGSQQKIVGGYLQRLAELDQRFQAGDGSVIFDIGNVVVS